MLAAGLLLAVLSYFPAQRIEFNRSVENMFAADDPIVPPYRMLKETFGGNEIVLAVYSDPELLSPDGRGIARLAALSERLRAVPGVRDVLSLDRPIGPTIVDPDNVVAARLRGVFAGYTHSTDGRMAAAVCLLEPDPPGASATGDSRVRTIAGLRAIMETLPDGLPPGMIAGEPVLVVEGFRSLESDGRLLATWSTFLVGLVIVVCFRSLRWVAIPLAVVQLALWLTYGLLVACGVRLTLVSGMLSAIITVVGIATTVHILVAYREARFAGQTPRAALGQAARLMAAPVIWSLVTDAAGFGSLLISKVGPVRDFGLMTSCGALLVLPCLLLLVPGMALAGPWDTTPRQAWGERGLGSLLEWSSRCVERYPRRLALGVLVLSILALSGLRRIEVETDFTRNFRSGERAGSFVRDDRVAVWRSGRSGRSRAGTRVAHLGVRAAGEPIGGPFASRGDGPRRAGRRAARLDEGAQRRGRAAGRRACRSGLAAVRGGARHRRARRLGGDARAYPGFRRDAVRAGTRGFGAPLRPLRAGDSPTLAAHHAARSRTPAGRAENAIDRARSAGGGRRIAAGSPGVRSATAKRRRGGW